jgi:KDO2-lipid IV(A) lauroyltransferase
MRRDADQRLRVRPALERLALWPLAAVGWVLAHLPLGLTLWLGQRLGDLAYWVIPGRRAVARQNLVLAFGGERPPRELAGLCRKSFQHLGMTLVESCILRFGAPTSLVSRVSAEGTEHLEAAMAQGKGVLFLSAHLGNWELLAAAHVLTGHRLSVVVRPMDSPILDQLVTRFREQYGVEVIVKSRAARGVLNALRRRWMVGILLDQHTSRREGVFVPFFGQPASTSKSLALLALWSGAPVVPVFIQREAAGHHRVTIEPVVPPPSTGDRRQDVAAFTATFARILESRIRERPEQWLWMHRRWKSRPGDELQRITDSGRRSAAP